MKAPPSRTWRGPPRILSSQNSITPRADRRRTQLPGRDRRRWNTIRPRVPSRRPPTSHGPSVCDSVKIASSSSTLWSTVCIAGCGRPSAAGHRDLMDADSMMLHAYPSTAMWRRINALKCPESDCLGVLIERVPSPEQSPCNREVCSCNHVRVPVIDTLARSWFTSNAMI